MCFHLHFMNETYKYVEWKNYGLLQWQRSSGCVDELDCWLGKAWTIYAHSRVRIAQCT